MSLLIKSNQIKRVDWVYVSCTSFVSKFWTLFFAMDMNKYDCVLLLTISLQVFRFMLLACKTYQTQSKVQTEFKLLVLFIRCLSYYIFIDYDSCTHKFVKLIHLLKLSDIRIFKFDLNLHRQLMSRLVHSKVLWTHWAFICCFESPLTLINLFWTSCWGR